jgi:CDP-diacylglycerol--glycerol-3-phosphate 3-phosphatidyltransferase
MDRSDPRLNLPNLLSAYRLGVSPLIVWAIFTGRRSLFFTLVCISLVTDILDGWIARRFHLETEFGARLDSLADDVTFFLAFLGLVILDREFVWEHRAAFILLLVSHLGGFLVSLLRFGRTTSMHLYSSKISGYLLGFFILIYFVFGYVAWYFYLSFGFSVLAYLEGLVITLISREPRSNVRGLYWILQEGEGARRPVTVIELSQQRKAEASPRPNIAP